MTDCPKEVKDELGLVQVYTGNGKGKTTAALGLGFRAVGCGLKVIMIQFLKPDEGCGEQIMGKRTPGFEIVPMGADHMNGVRVSEETEGELTAKAMAKCREVLTSGDYDIVILDEILNSLRFKLVTNEEIISMLDSRAPNTEVVLTGRGATPEIIEYADLVTEMMPVKHPAKKGIGARRGIEY